MRYLLAIDGGSQSTKVSVIGSDGRVHASAQVPLQPYVIADGGVAVHPDDDLWDSLVRAIVDALEQFTGSPEDIAGVGLCGIRSCRALVGDDDRLTEPVLSWMDDRVARPLGDAGAATLVTSAGGYLAVRLTGRRRDSGAAYAGRWPLDPDTMRWSKDPAVLRDCGMDEAMLPELVDPGEVLGTLLPEVADRTGLPSGCPVVATANDKAVEALGAGLTAPGTVLLSLGTYVAAMTVEPQVPDDPRAWRNPACLPGQYLAESAGVRRGMSTVAWLRGLVGAGSPTTEDDLEKLAAVTPPGADGLLTVPDWLAPADAVHRRGSIVGFDGRHGAGHLYRSVLEGLVLTMAGHVEAMEQALGGGPRELVVAGGGSRSPLMMQIVADAFGRPARRAGFADAAGLGAAVCAAVGAGVHASFAEAVVAMVRVDGPVWTPRPQVTDHYDRVRPVLEAARDATDPMYRMLAHLPSTTDR